MQPRAVWMQLAVVVAVLGYPGNDTAAQCIDQHPVEALTSNVDPIGQSWTSTCDGELRYLVVRADLPNPGTHTLSIYAGQSVAAGDLIASQSGILLADGENRIRLDDLPWITSGQQYTFVIDNLSNNLVRLRYDGLAGYPGGQAYNGIFFVAGADLWFQAQVTLPPIPTLNEWGRAVLIVLLLLASFAVMWKRMP